MNNKFLLIAALVVCGGMLFAMTHIVSASISSYSASGFSQFCSQNTTTCSKNENPGTREGVVSCPSSSQTIDAVYVHAGNGQTVFALPDSGYTENFSNNNNTVTVDVNGTGSQHPDLSWIAVVCSVHASPTPTPTNTPTVTPTPTSGPTVTPTPTTDPCANNACITPTVTPTPTCTGTCIVIDCDGGGTCAVNLGNTPTPTSGPTITPTNTPTATPIPASSGCTGNCGGSGDGKSDGKSSTSQQSQAVLGTSTQQGVLGISTMAATGTFAQNIMNSTALLGILSMALAGALYVKESKKIS